MKKQINRCMGCMTEKNYKGSCEICGYNGEPNPKGFLAPETFLADRYVIGKLIARNGEGCVYIAYDTVENRAAEIKEYMPDTLCEREEGSEAIVVKDGCLPLYKSYLSEFADLHKTLMSSTEGLSMKKIYGIFAAENTGYVVMEHPSGISFTEYLEKSGGIISWGEAKELLPPVFDALKALHELGIVHRGISTDTIFVTDKGRFMLTSIGISAGRTAESRINCEMYSGYAACEQYALSERQGSWTDVYGLCAVLYRALTGTTPPSAELREQEDKIISPNEINPDIPKHVSETILNGLKLIQSERIQNIDSLMRRLYTAPTGEIDPIEDDDDGPVSIENAYFTPAPRTSSEPRRSSQSGKKQGNSKSKKKGEKKTGVGTVIGFILFFVLIIAFIVAIIYFSKETENNTNPDNSQQTAVTEETTAATTKKPETTKPPKTEAEITAEPVTTVQTGGERIILPSFVSRFFNTSLESRYSGIIFVPEYEYKNEYQAGIIFEQDIDEGTEVTEGTEVHIKVSKGRATVALPDYIATKAKDYQKTLDEAKIRYELVGEETSEVKAGYVVRCSKEVGEQVNITEDGAETVTVYYAVKPAETTPEETEAAPEETEEITE